MNRFGLSGNALKIIALLAMTADHIGFILLPQYPALRVIGRLAFPIFAYMIGEGCRYTRSMGRYFGLLAGVAAVCQVVDYAVTGSLYQCILVTFSLSVALIAALRRARETASAARWLVALAALGAVFFLTEALPQLLPGTDYAVDYGFLGVLLPVGVYFAKNKTAKLCFTAAMLFLLGGDLGNVQMYALLALPLLWLYNGQRGKWRLKYLFYIYYPAHLAALHLIAVWS